MQFFDYIFFSSSFSTAILFIFWKRLIVILEFLKTSDRIRLIIKVVVGFLFGGSLNFASENLLLDLHHCRLEWNHLHEPEIGSYLGNGGSEISFPYIAELGQVSPFVWDHSRKDRWLFWKLFLEKFLYSQPTILFQKYAILKQKNCKQSPKCNISQNTYIKNIISALSGEHNKNWGQIFLLGFKSKMAVTFDKSLTYTWLKFCNLSWQTFDEALIKNWFKVHSQSFFASVSKVEKALTKSLESKEHEELIKIWHVFLKRMSRSKSSFIETLLSSLDCVSRVK